MEDEHVITIGVFAHANAGKTTITENLLYNAKVIDRIGRVDTGDTVTDSMKIERERGISIISSLVSFYVDGKKVQLIDTPGHVDFSAEVERAISVLDGAILVVSGVEGIESQTYTIWKALLDRKIPTVIFINKMDRIGSNYENTLKEIKEKLRAPIIPLVKVDNKRDSGLTIDELSTDELMEYLSDLKEGANDLLECYLRDNNSVSGTDIDKKIIQLSRSAQIYPVIGGSALKSRGIDRLLNCIGNYLPESKKELDKGFSAYIYTVRVDKGQKNTYIKVLLKQEVINMVNIIKDFYSKLGLWEDHWVSLSVRDYDHTEKYIGSSEDWDTCEDMLQEVSDELGLYAKRCEGEAALYGPKLDFMFKDAMGREIRIPTVQLDFATPKRFDLYYIDSNVEKVSPVMVHRAILGSYERFLVLLIENYAGAFPLWLSPIQVILFQ